jgi:CO/xanthine dehydrogenase Mo-binding subunit
MSDTGDTNGLAEPGQRRRPRLTRRRFLIATAVAGTAGAGLVIGFTLNSRQAAPGQTKPFKPNVWLQIDADDTVTITVGRCETGQGVLTGLATLAAEELDVDWSQVRVQQAPANIQYGNQRTTGSSSMSDSFTGMRLAGAQARALLVAAAARQWGVDVSTCRTAHGVVIHMPKLFSWPKRSAGRRSLCGRERTTCNQASTDPLRITGCRQLWTVAELYRAGSTVSPRRAWGAAWEPEPSYHMLSHRPAS